MNQRTVYVITNSYPEDNVMFSTYEFEYVLKNFKNVKVLSFSKTKKKAEDQHRVYKLRLIDGIKEFLFPTKKYNVNLYKSLKYTKSRDILGLFKNLYSFILALSVIRTNDINKEDLFFSYWLTRSSIIAYYLHLLLGTKYVCQGHGSDIYIYPPVNIKSILKNSKKIITVGNNNKKYISEKYDIPNDKIEVFKLGVSKYFSDSVLNEKSNYVNTNKVIFLTVARYENVKGIDLLLEAVRHLVLKNNNSELNIEFRIYGGGSQEENYRSYIKENKLENYVKLNGWIDREQLAQELSVVDCYILPSRSEGLPVAVMEACSASLPIIATNVGSVTEIAIENHNALICDAINAESICRKIERYLELDVQQIQSLRKNSFKVFKQEYMLERNLQRKYDYINKL